MSSTTEQPIELAIDRIRHSLSPRLVLIDRFHVAALAEVFELLPPITLHAGTNQLVDGVHRLAAARLLGHRTIRVQMWHGSEDDARVEAIRLNVAHGKPLTTEERDRAVRQVLTTHGAWSDRRIAEVCGVSVRRVAAARRQITTGETVATVGNGKDERGRAVGAAATRRQIAQLLDDFPEMSTRQLARRLSTSQATVRDVRSRRSQRLPLVPPRLDGEKTAIREPTIGLDLLSRDETAELEEWLARTAIDDPDWAERVRNVPLGRLHELADEAKRRSRSWASLAKALERRARGEA